MKKTTSAATCLMMTSVLMLGCDGSETGVDPETVSPREPEATMESTAPTPGAPTPMSDPALNTDDVEGKAIDMGAKMELANESAREQMAANAEALKERLPEAGGDIDVDSLDLSEGATLNEPQATAVVDKVRNLISTNSLDTAEQWINKLEGVNLPAGFDKYVTDLKKLLGQARQGMGSVGEMLGK